jgi:pimeloyl-ACP methyl ester carboxylesterase
MFQAKRRVFRLVLTLTFLAGSIDGRAQAWKNLPSPPPMPTPVRTGLAPVNGIRMYFATYGAGSPILLIHNGLGDADDWGGVVPLLERKYLVIVADSRGFGRSTRDNNPYSYELMAADYLGLLNFLNIGKVVVVGTSDGGVIGIDIAVHHPERLAGLFVQGANATNDGVRFAQTPVVKMALARAHSEYERLSPTPKDYVLFRQALDRMDETEPDYSKQELASIKTLTVIATGDHEESVKKTHTAYLAAAIPGARLVVLKDVGHCAPLQDPEQFAHAVLSLVDALPTW